VRVAGLVEYDGAGFSGWARQPGRRTVEGELTRALETVLRHPVRLTAAGRTDAGVHASGQVVSFDARDGTDPGTLAYKASAVLPEDVALRRCAAAPPGFDARRDATSRSYEYRIVNAPVRSPLRRRRAVHVGYRLDERLLGEAARRVLGVHDFRAFTPAKSHHVRFERAVSESRWERSGDLLVYRITADAFLYNMVRALVGTMLEVARGRRDLASFEELLGGARRAEGGPTAPARGLTLVRVRYAVEEVEERLWTPGC
jgi:tRNA pseudouridine38-40 synthase